MRSNHALRLVAVLLAATIATHAVAQACLFQAPLACDRARLIKTANDYLAALVAHDPSDVKLAADLFKIRDNRIHEIEALGFMVPYLSKGGWSDFVR